MKRKLFLTAAMVIFSSDLFANDSSEEVVYTSPLTTYSWGLGAGGVVSLNKDLKDASNNFLKVSFVNSVFFKENVSIFFDANWYAPGLNFGGDVGVDYYLSKSDFRPFLGVGVGAAYFDKTSNFSDNIGPSTTVHLGFMFDINESVQVRFRAPYTYVANEARDQFAGFDVGLLFTDKFKRVKKLEYNR